jgi:hypothetical protein
VFLALNDVIDPALLRRKIRCSEVMFLFALRKWGEYRHDSRDTQALFSGFLQISYAPQNTHKINAFNAFPQTNFG